MAHAINIRSDDKSAEAIRSLWVECSALELAPSMGTLKYPPHITLAIYDQIGIPELTGAFDSAFSQATRFTAKFEKLDYFETPQAIILWAAPILPDFVRSIHEHIHARVGVEQSRPHYRPGSWVPHCSLATSIELSRKDEAIAFANRAIGPFEVIFDVADCVSFLPVEVLHEKELLADA